MSKFGTAARTAAIAAVLFGASEKPGAASAFTAWRVTDVAADDVLNVRAYPSSGSRILVGYPSGAVLSMTGRCTGGVSLDSVGRLPKEKQRLAVRRVWCQAWLDPLGDGNYRAGWVNGRFIRPE